jgi:hypothetical protein
LASVLVKLSRLLYGISWYNNAKLLKCLNVTVTKTDYVGLLNVNKNKTCLSLPKKFVIISSGTSKRRHTKTWQKEKFAELMLLLKKIRVSLGN